MSNSQPSSMAAWIVAGLFGLVAWAVSFWGYDLAFLWALIIGIVVAIIVWWLLNMAWGDSGSAESAPMSSSVPASGASSTAASSSAAATSTTAAASTSAAVATAPSTAPAVEAKPAAKPKTAAKPKAAAKSKAAAKPKAASKPARKPVAADGRPEALKKPRAGGADDLKQIKGVGPKMEKMLNGMGFYHFDQVAGWRAKEVKWVDDNLEGFKGRVSRDEWVKQAKVLAKGGTTEFSKKVKKGGVY